MHIAGHVASDGAPLAPGFVCECSERFGARRQLLTMKNAEQDTCHDGNADGSMFASPVSCRMAWLLPVAGAMRFATAIGIALSTTACSPAANQPHASTPGRTNPTPEPAIPAILAAFDTYDVVAMDAGHQLKDVDDLILALVRDPHFPDKVNDIEVECGNSLYQPILDRYIAGLDIPFADARKVWRNTTQAMCGLSGFYEQLFPLVRAINQKLPAAKRLRVLAGDPPVDWDTIKTPADASTILVRDPSIASVMEKEVLSKHRKALMLFGTFHLMHVGSDGRVQSEPNAPPTAVSIYEKHYPNRTFVISELGIYDTTPFASWPHPSLVRTKGTSLGALSLKDLKTPPVLMRDCKVTVDFPPNLQKPVETLIDAFIYLGPQKLALTEPTPAAIALDAGYMTELLRRDSLLEPPGAPVESLKEISDDFLREAEAPIQELPPPPDVRAMEQHCLEQQKR